MRGPPNKAQRNFERSGCLEKILKSRFMNLIINMLIFSIPALLKVFVFNQMAVWEYLILFIVLYWIWISFKENKDFITPLVREVLNKYINNKS